MRSAIFTGRFRGGKEPESGARRGALRSPMDPIPLSERQQLVEEAVEIWRSELITLGGANALQDIAVLGNTVLDLTTAHPSGIAQLYAGRRTPLGNIVREVSAQRSAREKAAQVQEVAQEHASRYGLPPTQLCIGIAMWTEVLALEDSGDGDPRNGDGEPEIHPGEPEALTASTQAIDVREIGRVRSVRRRIPVLTRPINLVDLGRGPELELEPVVEVNPVLIKALRSHGALIDGKALAAECFNGVGFNPAPVLERIRGAGASVIDDFIIKEKLIVGVFSHPGQMLADDLDSASDILPGRPIVAALAGDASAREAFASQQLPAKNPGDKAPENERGIGDLDPDQQYVVDVAASGRSFFINAAPGAPTADIVAAIAADAAGSGRSFVYVPSGRYAAEAVTSRLRHAGLNDIVLDLKPTPGWQRDAVNRMRSSLSAQIPELDVQAVARLRTALGNRREKLSGYMAALHNSREPWGVSAYESLQALAAIVGSRSGAVTSVRLPAKVTAALKGDSYTAAREALVRCAELGAFTLRSQDTAWYGADIEDGQAAEKLLETLDSVSGDRLAKVLADVDSVIEQTGLIRPKTLASWAEELDMLAGVRQALDIFQPMVFERSAEDMIAATASQEWRNEHGIKMSSVNRRRLRKQAKDMVRPGRVVPDLHDALVHMQAQREVWIKWCPAGTWPRLPGGMSQTDADFQRLRSDLDILSRALRTTPEGLPLDQLPLEDIQRRLDRLNASRHTLAFIPETTKIMRALRAQGLGPLLDDLRSRRSGAGRQASKQNIAGLAGQELDLAWWRSVLEQILSEDPLLSQYDGTALTALVDSFQQLDRAHVASLPGPIRAAVAAWLDKVKEDFPLQAQTLAATVETTSLREVVASCPEVTMKTRPVWVATPMMVAQALPLTESAGPSADVLLLDGAHQLNAAEVVSALARAKQVIVIADAARASDSVANELETFLPPVQLDALDSRRDPRLTEFLGDLGYTNVRAPLPLPNNEELTEFIFVPKAVAGIDGMSSPAEVDAVVEYVSRYARVHAEESLAIVAGSLEHAERVRIALIKASESDPVLERFCSVESSEPIVITDVTNAAGLNRESVIFSPGFARTTHGSILHNFGPLSTPGADVALLDMLLITRHRFAIISALRPEDLDPKRLRTPGTRLFERVLSFAYDLAPAAQPQGDLPDPLFLDFAEKLWQRGLIVDARYGLENGVRVPLAIGAPELPDRHLVAVLTDDPDFVEEPSLRVQMRLRAERLARLGWRVLTEWSTAVFLDPEGRVDAVAKAVAEERAKIRR